MDSSDTVGGDILVLTWCLDNQELVRRDWKRRKAPSHWEK